MKKLAVLVASVMMAGSASGQIAILWDSTVFWQIPGSDGTWPTGYVQPGALHTLVWSTTPMPTEDHVWFGTQGIGNAGDEWVLWSGGVPNVGATFDYRAAPLIFNDADVGGNNINNGYVYSRIFQGPGTEVGDWYYQSLVFLGSSIPEYDPKNTQTIQDHRTTSAAGTFAELGDVDNPAYGAGMYQVIPEPSVYAMLVLGLGFMGFRRFFRREQ